MPKYLFTTLLFSFSIFSLIAQPTIEEAEDFFGSFLTERSQNAFIVNSTPSLSDVRLVLKDSVATDYYSNIRRQFDEKKMPLLSTFNKIYASCRVSKFKTEDIAAGKVGYVTGGMKAMRQYVNDGITFYSVVYLKEPDDEYGLRYNYFVYLDGRWVIIPKIWRYLK